MQDLLPMRALVSFNLHPEGGHDPVVLPDCGPTRYRFGR